MQYFQILPPLVDLCHVLEARIQSGDSFSPLSLIYHQSKSGHPDIQYIFRVLHHDCCKVLFKQLTSWMFYGKLMPECQFFVNMDQSAAPESTRTKVEWETLYTLDHRLIPDYISLDVCKDILFAGKAIVTLRHRIASAGLMGIANDLISEAEIQKHIERLIESLPSESSYCYSWKTLDFEVAVTEWKKAVSQLLWKHMVVGEDIMNHLQVFYQFPRLSDMQNFRQFYLLGCGEIFGLFIQEAEKTASRSKERLAKVTSFDLNMTMKRAVGRFDSDELERFFSKFTFVLDPPAGTGLVF